MSFNAFIDYNISIFNGNYHASVEFSDFDLFWLTWDNLAVSYGHFGRYMYHFVSFARSMSINLIVCVVFGFDWSQFRFNCIDSTPYNRNAAKNRINSWISTNNIYYTICIVSIFYALKPFLQSSHILYLWLMLNGKIVNEQSLNVQSQRDELNEIAEAY